MLDRVHPVLDRGGGAVEAFNVGGDLDAHAMGFVDECGELDVGELDRVRVLHLVGPSAGGHHFDEVRARTQLLSYRLADVIRAVSLPVHRAIEPPTR